MKKKFNVMQYERFADDMRFGIENGRRLFFYLKFNDYILDANEINKYYN